FLFLYVFFSSCFCHPLDLHSFPTRRSSDLLPRSGISVDADSFCPRGCRYRRQCRVSRAPRSRAISEPHRCHHFVCDGTSGLPVRSEEHTSELQSQSNLVCRLLLEKKKKNII